MGKTKWFCNCELSISAGIFDWKFENVMSTLEMAVCLPQGSGVGGIPRGCFHE